MQDDTTIAKESLKTAVAAIRHHHNLKKQPPPDPDTASVTPSDADTPHEYDLVLDGYMSVVLVIEAAAKCLYLRHSFAAKLTINMYCEHFLKGLKCDHKLTKQETQDVMQKLIGIRNAHSHANAQYLYLPHDPASKTLYSMFILYEQTREKHDGTDYREVHRYTMRQFAHLCTTMREVFLSWYLNDPTKKTKIGMKEVQMAVMARYAICQQSCPGPFSSYCMHV